MLDKITQNFESFQKGFGRDEFEEELYHLTQLSRDDYALLIRFQEKYQSNVIESDVFTNRPHPTNAQIQHAIKNIPTMRQEVLQEIEEIKQKGYIRGPIERFRDGISSVLSTKQ